jgi:UDP-N-acetylmuramoyl-tripeptide--D-alanyl-D-alanine ligase
MMIGLTDIATAISSSITPPPAAVSGWSVDSRTIRPGDLFFALKGPNHDGHRYVEQAFAGGAVAAVVDRPVEAQGSLLPVEDSLIALQALASWARRRWNGTVVAVTGSAGKTSTKDIIAHLLESFRPAGKTAGNFNNHVGVPLSILLLPDDRDVAVLELGMNHAGEIRELAKIAAPSIGVVTNVGYAHSESFDSIDGVALAKRELIESLPLDGTAVLNADDERVARFREVHDGPVLTYGFSPSADIRALQMERTEAETRFEVDGAGWFVTPLAGRHSVLNILAGMAVARLFGIAPNQLRDAVETLEPGEMRGRRFSHRGITVLDDCYNSNPEAVRAMLETLRDIPARRRIAVLGEMLELGRMAGPLHQEIGRVVAACRVDVLVGIRGAARLMADAAVAAGVPSSAAYFFPEPEPAGDQVKELAREGDVILFKGSRGTHVERALERFLDETRE